MKTKYLILIGFVLIFSFVIINSQNLDRLDLTSGKNYITFEDINPIYVKDFIKLNPEIDVISYRENNQTIGYANAFGGLGTNFIISNGITYEIIVKQNVSIILPS